MTAKENTPEEIRHNMTASDRRAVRRAAIGYSNGYEDREEAFVQGARWWAENAPRKDRKLVLVVLAVLLAIVAIVAIVAPGRPSRAGYKVQTEKLDGHLYYIVTGENGSAQAIHSEACECLVAGWGDMDEDEE